MTTNDSKKKGGYLFIIFVIIPFVAILKLNETISIERDNLIQLEKHLEEIKFIQVISKQLSILDDYLSSMKIYNNMTKIYIVSTVSMTKRSELANLVKMSNTLSLVPKLCWILVENSLDKSAKLAHFLEDSHLEYVHLNYRIEFSEFYSNNDIEITLKNFALNWLISNTLDLNAVVHFIQIDNTYDVKIFNEMRTTKKVSVWPVAFVDNSIYHGPICKNKKFVSWLNIRNISQPYLIDSAEFSFNLNHLKSKKNLTLLNMYSRKPYDDFINYLVEKKGFEPKAEECTKIYVWKTITSLPYIGELKELLKLGLTYDKELLDRV